jgi:Protein of unknown function (DUF3352)
VRRTLAALTGVLALVAAGCGGGGSGDGGGGKATSLPDAASVVPESAPVLVTVNTDFSSDQWKRVTALFRRFPEGPALLAQLEKQLPKGVTLSQIGAALGPEFDIAFLDFARGGTVIELTKPKDKAKLKALLAKGKHPLVSEDIGDWTAVADKQAALTQFDTARKQGTLDGSSAFEQAVKDVPGDAAVKLYVNGQAIQAAVENALAQSGVKGGTSQLGTLGSIVAWASAKQDGVSLGGDVNGSFKGAPGTYRPALPGELPAGALAVLSFAHLDKPLGQLYKAVESASPSFKTQVTQAEGLLGLSVEGDVLPIFSGEGALAVYPPSAKTASIPDIVLVQKVSDESKVRTLLARLAPLLAASGSVKVTPVTVAGVSAERLTFGRVSVVAAVFDGKLVVTNAETLIPELKATRDRLAGDTLYRQASAAAGMPSDVLGFLYLNLRAGLQTVFGLAEQSGSTVPKAVRDNTAPLRSALLYATSKSGGYRLGGFVTVK